MNRLGYIFSLAMINTVGMIGCGLEDYGIVEEMSVDSIQEAISIPQAVYQSTNAPPSYLHLTEKKGNCIFADGPTTDYEDYGFSADYANGKRAKGKLTIWCGAIGDWWVTSAKTDNNTYSGNIVAWKNNRPSRMHWNTTTLSGVTWVLIE